MLSDTQTHPLRLTRAPRLHAQRSTRTRPLRLTRGSPEPCTVIPLEHTRRGSRGLPEAMHEYVPQTPLRLTAGSPRAVPKGTTWTHRPRGTATGSPEPCKVIPPRHTRRGSAGLPGAMHEGYHPDTPLRLTRAPSHARVIPCRHTL